MSYLAWMEQADDDLMVARALSVANHHSQAVWLAAQAVEKAHKAVLLALGLRYEEKHLKQLGHGTSEILKLLPLALHEPPDPQIAIKVQTLEALALSARYPEPAQLAGMIKKELVAPAKRFTSSQREVEDAQQVVEWCRERVTRALRAVTAMAP